MDDVPNGKSEPLCKVCGDKASGKHYGVSSCDGCRGFFKRSIRRNLDYVCKENGRCIVDVTRRNQCQSCRFRKCLQVSMKRDAVQHERAPRTTVHASMHHYPLTFAPRLRGLQGLQPTTFFAGLQGLQGLPLHLHAPTTSLLESSMHTNYIQPGLLYPNMLPTTFSKPIFSSTIYPKPLFPSSSPSTISQHSQILKEDEVTSSEEASCKTDSVIPSIQVSSDDDMNSNQLNGKRLELPILNTEHSPTNRRLEISPITMFPAENIYESAAKLLFLSIKWARSIPSFLQLSYRDQSVLLEESWSELFILTAAQWALPIDESLLVVNAIAPSSRQLNLEEDARKLRDVINRLSLLRVDHTEHACLKALVLFKAECRGLCESKHVEMLQDQTHVMLAEYCSQRQGTQKGRFGKLLLALPALQSVSRRSLEELLFKQTVGDVAIDRLLGDLAKATQPS